MFCLPASIQLNARLFAYLWLLQRRTRIELFVSGKLVFLNNFYFLHVII